MTNQITLENFGIFTSRIPEDLFKKLKIECLNFINKEKMISGLTSNGVPEHYYLEDNNIELFNFLNEWIKNYDKEFNYLKNFRILNKDAILIFQKPWLNIQKKGEFIPTHTHDGVFSYTIWIQLPNLDIINNKFAGCFEFQYQNILGHMSNQRQLLTKTDEGRFILFPSKLSHCVYPFFDNDELRISISGNVVFDNK